MEANEKLSKLSLLTLEADALTEVLEGSMKYQEYKEDDYIAEIFLVEVIREKFSKMRDLF